MALQLRDLKPMAIMFLALLLLGMGSCIERRLAHADDPMNKPLETLGVFDYDRRLCNDRWNTCGDYERRSFDYQYPGRSITELGLYPEAEPYRDPTGDVSEHEGWIPSYEGGATEEYAPDLSGY